MLKRARLRVEQRPVPEDAGQAPVRAGQCGGMAVTETDIDVLRARYAQERARRLRPDGNDQYVALEGSSPVFSTTLTPSAWSVTRSVITCRLPLSAGASRAW